MATFYLSLARRKKQLFHAWMMLLAAFVAAPEAGATSLAPDAGDRAAAVDDSLPVGDWYTVHEDTKKATSVVRIAWENSQLVGRVVKVLKVDKGDDPICERCEGERHNQHLVGMSILWGLTGKGGSYEGGFVLDPSNGKQYRAKITMRGHDVLQLRGYIGLSVFGRTQTWQRVPKDHMPHKEAP